jgi:hypothetical protein
MREGNMEAKHTRGRPDKGSGAERATGPEPSAPGHGAPILIGPDPAPGELFLYVWADITQGDCTHKISLAGAHERQRQGRGGQQGESGD